VGARGHGSGEGERPCEDGGKRWEAAPPNFLRRSRLYLPVAQCDLLTLQLNCRRVDCSLRRAHSKTEEP